MLGESCGCPSARPAKPRQIDVLHNIAAHNTHPSRRHICFWRRRFFVRQSPLSPSLSVRVFSQSLHTNMQLCTYCLLWARLRFVELAESVACNQRRSLRYTSGRIRACLPVRRMFFQIFKLASSAFLRGPQRCSARQGYIYNILRWASAEIICGAVGGIGGVQSHRCSLRYLWRCPFLRFLLHTQLVVIVFSLLPSQPLCPPPPPGRAVLLSG